VLLGAAGRAHPLLALPLRERGAGTRAGTGLCGENRPSSGVGEEGSGAGWEQGGSRESSCPPNDPFRALKGVCPAHAFPIPNRAGARAKGRNKAGSPELGEPLPHPARPVPSGRKDLAARGSLGQRRRAAATGLPAAWVHSLGGRRADAGPI
jgi:hypothetical protein